MMVLDAHLRPRQTHILDFISNRFFDDFSCSPFALHLPPSPACPFVLPHSETDDGFKLDLDAVKKMVTPKTSVFIYNNFQNPMGACSTDEEMKDIAEFCVSRNLWVLSDEAYFDIVFGA